MKRISVLIIIFFSVALSAFSLGCVTDTATLKIEKSLPQDKLAYYNDSFDKFRTDLWDEAGFIPNATQKANFKLAKMQIQNGKLWVQTETGCFSKGGVGSKFGLRGDFDIQVDCQIDFLDDAYDMDQLLLFAVLDKGQDLDNGTSVLLSMLKEEDSDFNAVFSAFMKNGELHLGNWDRRRNWDVANNFNGTLRIVRIEDRTSTLFKRKGDTQWNMIENFQSITNDIMVGFSLSNFISMRTSITAKAPITATFDNFKINAAEEIIEEDI